MSATRKVVISLTVAAILAVAAIVSVSRAQDRGVEVRAEEVAERDLVSTITATGSVRARRQVNISSDISGRVIALNVDEGEAVTRGQVLLRIDPSQTEAAVARARATLAQSEAQVAQQRSNLGQAHRDADRLRELMARDGNLVSRQSLEDAETRVEVQHSLLLAAEHGVAQARAALQETEDHLAKTTILAPISGLVTRLNIEEGETVVIGTMNNPGSLLLTISDLTVVEAVLAVDETDLPRISIGDSAVVELDALPGRQFAARVEKIGNSAIRPPGAPGPTTQTSVDYEVILTLLDPPAELRPDLSAVADIVVEHRERAVSVPIISVTVRDAPGGTTQRDTATRPGGPLSRASAPGREEGVFVLANGRAVWRPVEIGIAGQEYFEVLSGVGPGDSVVAGPFQRIRDLRDGDAVRVQGSPRRD